MLADSCNPMNYPMHGPPSTHPGIELMITFWPFVGLPYDNGTAVSRHWDEFNQQVRQPLYGAR